MWNNSTLTSKDGVLQTLTGLLGKRWLCRGQPEPYCNLLPSIDRDGRLGLSRAPKLTLERESIDVFRSTASIFWWGEHGAARNDIIALMVLRHYGVPTRLLDWSRSPFVAAHFATECNNKDGEIWCFDEPRYEKGAGPQQWKKWPETTSDGSGNGDKFDASLTAFRDEEPPDWIISASYPTGFLRQSAQAGAYTMTARLGRDHAPAISDLFAGDPSAYHLYIVPAELKPEIRTMLRNDYGIWQGSLFPDTAGAAEEAKKIFDRE